MKFIGLRWVRTHTHTHACKHTRCMTTNSRSRAAILMKMINKLMKVVVTHARSSFFLLFFNPTQLVSTPLPPWRNNRSITPFCHLTEREKWGSDWKGSLASWCCVSGLSVRRETLMDCRDVETHTHTESLQGVETFPCCSSQGGRALLLFYPRIITHYEEHTVDKECGQSVTNLPFFTIISLMLCYAATEAYNGVT